ncbi:MAG TPA: DUF190 domain-containing protein [Candidatus Acidoferrales bacterium]|nr:DUF190 domain-containing protein [Candidatus Acidoferrales bacterium]
MVDFKRGQLLRVFVDEEDRHGLQPMYTAVVELLRSKHIAGATVFRGVEGFGQHEEIHIAKVFSWLPNLPILIEVIDDKDKIDRIIPDLEELIGEGLISVEAVDYRRIERPAKAKRAHA